MRGHGEAVKLRTFDQTIPIVVRLVRTPACDAGNLGSTPSYRMVLLRLHSMNRTYQDRREYMRKYQSQWIQKRRKEYLAGKACVNCGSLERLEIDHIDPKQKVSHRVWSWSESRRIIELQKCQILCHSCHKEKTRSSYPGLIHGTTNAYDHYGCRCQLCRRAVADSRADYRARTGKR